MTTIMSSSGDRFNLTLSYKSDGVGQQVVESDALGDNEEWLIGRVAIQDDDNSATFARLQIKGPGGPTDIYEWSSLSAGRLHEYSTSPIPIRGGQSLAVLFSGTTANDVLRVHLQGVKMRRD